MSDLRLVAVHYDDGDTSPVDPVPSFHGWFHGWTNTAQEVPHAIVEKEDGWVTTVPRWQVRFVTAPMPQQPPVVEIGGWVGGKPGKFIPGWPRGRETP